MARGANATFSPAMTSTATRPSCDALCASIGSPTTSPMAKIDGSSVRMLLVDDDEAARRRRGTRGPVEPGNARVRPAADGHEHAIEQPALALCRRSPPAPFERDADAPWPPPSSATTRVLSRTAFIDLRSHASRGRRRDRGRLPAAAGRHLDDGDAAAERGVDRSELQADVAAADDEQRFRNIRADRAPRSNPSHADRRSRSEVGIAGSEPVARIA